MDVGLKSGETISGVQSMEAGGGKFVEILENSDNHLCGKREDA